MTYSFTKSVIMIFLLFFINCNYCKSQNVYSENDNYFKSLNISNPESYDYIIIYPLQYLGADGMWVDHLMNVELYKWEGLLFVIVIHEKKQLAALNDYALKRENLIVDSTLTFQNKPFYNELPVIYSFKDKVLKEVVVLNIYNSYPWWSKLYELYKN